LSQSEIASSRCFDRCVIPRNSKKCQNHLLLPDPKICLDFDPQVRQSWFLCANIAVHSARQRPKVRRPACITVLEPNQRRPCVRPPAGTLLLIQSASKCNPPRRHQSHHPSAFGSPTPPPDHKSAPRPLCHGSELSDLPVRAHRKSSSHCLQPYVHTCGQTISTILWTGIIVTDYMYNYLWAEIVPATVL
jgi:hypothetical protein